eukprot:1154731-Pelagomonas_calceolata.AAC.2
MKELLLTRLGLGMRRGRDLDCTAEERTFVPPQSISSAKLRCADVKPEGACRGKGTHLYTGQSAATHGAQQKRSTGSTQTCWPSASGVKDGTCKAYMSMTWHERWHMQYMHIHEHDLA